jgi:predicted nucleotidyltransferase
VPSAPEPHWSRSIGTGGRDPSESVVAIVGMRTLGATSLYLFGSVVRDEAKAASDLDLFIDYDRDGRFNAFDLVGIKQYLENELSVDIDVTTRDGLHPMLRSDIEKSAVRVF